MDVSVNSPVLHELLDTEAPLERLATGFEFTEGPIWHPDGFLLFSDILGNAIWRWSAEEGIREWRRPSNMSNGLTYDAELRLLSCEHATSRVTRAEPDGSIAVVASHFEGKELNSPNDVVVRSDGSIYFTDPPGGRMAEYGVERARELAFQGVFRISPSGAELELLVADFGVPNGLCFSPDEQLLYVNDTVRMHIRVFDVRPDGGLENGRVFFVQERSAVAGVPDGMKTDARGNIFCTGPGGIWVISPAAEHLGTLRVPELARNLNWGDADRKDLYITAGRSLYRTRARVTGASSTAAAL